MKRFRCGNVIQPLFAAIAVCVVVCLSSCRSGDDKPNTSVRLKLSSSQGEMIYLEKVTVDGTARLDSGRTNRDGEIVFRFFSPDFDFLLLGDGVSTPVMLLAEREEEISVFTTSGVFGDDYTVKGSGGSALLLELERRKGRTVARLDSIGQVWLRVRYDNDNIRQKEILDSVAEGVIEDHREWLKGFIGRYPGSPATIVAVYQTLRHSLPLLTYQDHLEIFTSITAHLLARFPNNPHVLDLQGRHDLFVREYNAFLQREEKLQPGMPAPPVALTTIQGERVTLSDLEGRYVLLHFWDGRKQRSWEDNTRLKELYPIYRYRGFEILGIYIGDDRQMFQNIVAGDALPWLHMFGNTGVEKGYNVLQKEPQMVLVDREGKILRRRISVEELATLLPRLMPLPGERVIAEEEVVNGNQ